MCSWPQQQQQQRGPGQKGALTPHQHGYQLALPRWQQLLLVLAVVVVWGLLLLLLVWVDQPELLLLVVVLLERQVVSWLHYWTHGLP